MFSNPIWLSFIENCDFSDFLLINLRRITQNSIEWWIWMEPVYCLPTKRWIHSLRARFESSVTVTSDCMFVVYDNHSVIFSKNKNSFRCQLVVHHNFGDEMSSSSSNDLEHHKRLEYCHNRLQYRNGRQPTAVKVRTNNIILQAIRFPYDCIRPHAGLYHSKWVQAFASIWSAKNQFVRRSEK